MVLKIVRAINKELYYTIHLTSKWENLIASCRFLTSHADSKSTETTEARDDTDVGKRDCMSPTLEVLNFPLNSN